MSWYNDDPENNFIDGTQEFTGGGASTSVSIIQNTEDLVISETTPNTEEETTIGNVLLPAVFNEETGTYDLYIRNVNQGGKIFLTTRGDGEQVKIDDGRLWGYYNYNPIISAITLSKWIDITDDTVRARQGADNALTAALGAAGVAADAEIKASGAASAASVALSAAQSATTISGQAFTTATAISQQLSKIKWYSKPIREVFENIGKANHNALRNGITANLDSVITQMAAQSANLVRLGITASSLGRFQLGITILSSYLGAGLTAGVIAGIAYLFDYLSKENDRETLSYYLRLIEENEKNGVSLGTTQDVAHLTGLQIVSATNGGFTTAGTYQVDIGNGAEVVIEVSQAGTATITEVLGGGESFTLSQIISISKDDLGGYSSGTSDLEINIISLISEKDFVENELQLIKNNIEETENRQRRRRNIPNTSSYSTDGFNITNTQITEPNSAEITNEPTISLKLDTSQFNYDASGNLQLTNHANIGYTGNLGIPSDPSATPPVLGISAVPSPQAAELLPSAFAYHANICAIEMRACFSLMLGFSERLPLDFEAAHVTNSDLSWIAINSQKPGRVDQYTLMVHSSGDYAEAHIDDDREAVMQHLIAQTSRIIGHDVSTADYKTVHGWRYANNAKREISPVFLDQNLKLAACGDWCLGGRVEGAFTSSHRLFCAMRELAL